MYSPIARFSDKKCLPKMAKTIILNQYNPHALIKKNDLPLPVKKYRFPDLPILLTADSMAKRIISGQFLASNPFFGSAQIRMSHTDLETPNFDDYRLPNTMDPETAARETCDKRKLFTYMFTAAVGASAVYASKNVATKLIYTMSPGLDVMAQAQLEVDLTTIPEGKTVVLKWRGKPLFIKHRTSTDISKEESTDLSHLRDPQPDSVRVQKPQWLILIGICTHLGCIPIANAGDYPGGFYCPCHGSHYDGSGRIRKGPAPLNLEVPPYDFVNENLVVVG